MKIMISIPNMISSLDEKFIYSGNLLPLWTFHPDYQYLIKHEGKQAKWVTTAGKFFIFIKLYLNYYFYKS